MCSPPGVGTFPQGKPGGSTLPANLPHLYFTPALLSESVFSQYTSLVYLYYRLCRYVEFRGLRPMFRHVLPPGVGTFPPGDPEVVRYMPTYHTFISHMPSSLSLCFHNIPHFYTFTIQLPRYVELRGRRPCVPTCPRPQCGNLPPGEPTRYRAICQLTTPLFHTCLPLQVCTFTIYVRFTVRICYRLFHSML